VVGGKIVFWVTAFAAMFIGCTDTDMPRANGFLESGDYLRAREIYARILERTPNNYPARYGMGMTYSAEAIHKTELGMAKPLDWYPAVYHLNLAANLMENSDVHATLAVLHYNLATMYRKQGDTESAVERLEQAVTYDSTLLKAVNLLGTLYHQDGYMEDAARCYRQVVSISPEYAMAHFNLGAVDWALGDLESAYERFVTADSLSPGNEYFESWLQRAHARLAENSE